MTYLNIAQELTKMIDEAVPALPKWLIVEMERTLVIVEMERALAIMRELVRKQNK